MVDKLHRLGHPKAFPSTATYSTTNIRKLCADGRRLMVISEHALAIPCFQEALKLDPHFPAARQGLNVCVRQLIRSAKAAFKGRSPEEAKKLLGIAETAGSRNLDIIDKIAKARGIINPPPVTSIPITSLVIEKPIQPLSPPAKKPKLPQHKESKPIEPLVTVKPERAPEVQAALSLEPKPVTRPRIKVIPFKPCQEDKKIEARMLWLSRKLHKNPKDEAARDALGDCAIKSLEKAETEIKMGNRGRARHYIRRAAIYISLSKSPQALERLKAAWANTSRFSRTWRIPHDILTEFSLSHPWLEPNEVGKRRQSVIEFLLTDNNLTMKKREIMAATLCKIPPIYSYIYDRRVFPGGIGEARLAAKEAKSKAEQK